MKKIILLSILATVVISCAHKKHGGHAGCDPAKPCTMESKDGKKTECEDCKKGS